MGSDRAAVWCVQCVWDLCAMIYDGLGSGGDAGQRKMSDTKRRRAFPVEALGC